MKQVAEVVAQSVAQDPTKHITAISVASAGVVNGNNHTLGFLPEWLPIGDLAVVVAVFVGVMTFIKTYNENKLARLKIKQAEESLDSV